MEVDFRRGAALHQTGALDLFIGGTQLSFSRYLKKNKVRRFEAAMLHWRRLKAHCQQSCNDQARDIQIPAKIEILRAVILLPTSALLITMVHDHQTIPNANPSIASIFSSLNRRFSFSDWLRHGRRSRAANVADDPSGEGAVF